MYGVDLHRARVSALLLRKHLYSQQSLLPIPATLPQELNNSAPTNDSHASQSNPHDPLSTSHHVTIHHRQSANLCANGKLNNNHLQNMSTGDCSTSHSGSQQTSHAGENNSADVSNEASQNISATFPISNVAFRRHGGFSRGAVLSAGQSIRKSIRRIPQMMAQLTAAGRAGTMGAYGASTNASDEFIVSKPDSALVTGAKDATDFGGLPAVGASSESAPAIELIGNGFSSDLINPLCMVSLLCFCFYFVLFFFSFFVMAPSADGTIIHLLFFCLLFSHVYVFLFSHLSEQTYY